MAGAEQSRRHQAPNSQASPRLADGKGTLTREGCRRRRFSRSLPPLALGPDLDSPDAFTRR
eukprot:3455054-Pyramimonas_sp.AAC.1